MRPTFENRSYDAFHALLAHLQTGAAAAAEPACSPAAPDVGSSQVQGAAGPADREPAVPRPPGGNNVKVIVRIDHVALLRGATVAGETCEVAGLGPISVTAARELMRSDVFLAAVITKGRDVVNVAHLGRGLNAHQRTAIEAMGLRCSNQVCNKTIALQIDHRTPYAVNPETKLDNQDPLCPDCHRRKTHHGWQLEPGTGPRRFVPPAHAPPGPRAEPPGTDTPRSDSPAGRSPTRGPVTARAVTGRAPPRARQATLL